jgi:hypothetical protein
MLLLVLAAACSKEDETGTATAVPQATTLAETAVPTATLTPLSPTATSAPPTATPSPTPIQPAITVADQDLGEDGRLRISSVQIAEAGWVVVHAQRDGAVGEVLGFTAVAPDENSDIEVQIDPLQATDTLAVTLHDDLGEAGTFEFPGVDAPLQTADGAVQATFSITRQFLLPSINISAQTVAEDGVIQADSVQALTAGWLLIYAQEADGLGPLLGFAQVDEGINEAVPIVIHWREASSQLQAVLVADNGRAALYDPGEDLPVLLDGAPVMTSFKVTLPLDIYVLDQPILDGKVVIERVTSDGPGWIVVHPDNGEGQLGLIIGFTHVEDGVNEQVEVALITNNITDQMFVKLHSDEEPVDEFDFPDGDLPVRVDDRVPPPASFFTNMGNYLITRDQPAGDSVTIPLVVVVTPAWLVVYADAEQTEQLGLILLEPGINRDVIVPITGAAAGDMVVATLHSDVGTPGEFNYPDGVDLPMQRNRSVIQAPFELQ